MPHTSRVGEINSFPAFIHFFGPDGAGKSTQVDLLFNYCLSKQMKIRKYWMRSPHTLAYVLSRFFLKIGFIRVVSNKSGTYVKVPAVDRNRVLVRFWSLIEFVSILPLVFRARLYLLSGYRLIAERFVLDTIAYVAYSTNNEKFSQSPISKLFFALIPSKTRFILIDADYDTIFLRRKAHTLRNAILLEESLKSGSSALKTELEPQEFIEFQRKIYRILAHTTKALIIDTSHYSVKDTFCTISRYLSGQ